MKRVWILAGTEHFATTRSLDLDLRPRAWERNRRLLHSGPGVAGAIHGHTDVHTSTAQVRSNGACRVAPAAFRCVGLGRNDARATRGPLPHRAALFAGLAGLGRGSTAEVGNLEEGEVLQCGEGLDGWARREEGFAADVWRRKLL